MLQHELKHTPPAFEYYKRKLQRHDRSIGSRRRKSKYQPNPYRPIRSDALASHCGALAHQPQTIGNTYDFLWAENTTSGIAD
jgi:hypothetical protein